MLGNFLPVGPAQQTTKQPKNVLGVHSNSIHYAYFVAQGIPRNTSGKDLQRHDIVQDVHTLKTLTSLNKESLSVFFLGDNSIWSFLSVLLVALTASGGPEAYFGLAIIAFEHLSSLSRKTGIA